MSTEKPSQKKSSTSFQFPTTSTPQVTNLALDATKTVMSGEPPSNQQIHQVLDTTKEFIKEKKEEAPTTQTKKVLGDASELVEATQQILENKNKDEHLQKLVSTGAKSIVDTGKEKVKSISQDKGKEFAEKAKNAGEASRKAGQASLNVVKMMLTNGDFRAWFLDFAGFIHDALYQAYQKFESKSFEQSKFQGIEQQTMQQKGFCPSCSCPTDKCQCVKSGQCTCPPGQCTCTGSWKTRIPLQYSGKWTEEMKQKLAERFMELLQKLNSHPDFALGARNLFDALDDLKEKAKETGEEIKEQLTGEENLNEDTQLALDHARILVERFSGRKLDTLLDALDRFVNHLRERKDIDQWLNDARKLFEDAAKDPQNIGGSTQLRQRVQQLIDLADHIRHEISENDNDFRIIVDESKAIFERIRNDPDVKHFNEKAAQFFENFTYTDPADGKRRINRDLIVELRQYVVPLLLKQLEEIPVPTFEGHNEDYDYRIENLVLSGSDIIPDRVMVYFDSEFEFNVSQLEAEKGSTTALLKVSDIKTKIPGVRFWIHKKTFPSIEDSGTANISITKKGAVLKIFLKIENLFTEKPTFVFSKVQFFIDALSINIIETKHTVLTPILTGLWKTKIKRTIEEQAEKKIIEIAKSMEDGLNGLLNKYPPARLAQIATDTLSTASEKFVLGVKNIKDTASSKLESISKETPPRFTEVPIKTSTDNLDQKLFGNKTGSHPEETTLTSTSPNSA